MLHDSGLIPGCEVHDTMNIIPSVLLLSEIPLEVLKDLDCISNACRRQNVIQAHLQARTRFEHERDVKVLPQAALRTTHVICMHARFTEHCTPSAFLRRC